MISSFPSRNDAELCNACVDDRLVTRIISGVADQNLRRKLLAIDPPPSLAEALRVCRSEESAVHTETELASTRRTIGRAASKTQRYRSASRHRQGEGSVKCEGCGNEPHPRGRQKQCKASVVTPAASQAISATFVTRKPLNNTVMKVRTNSPTPRVLEQLAAFGSGMLNSPCRSIAHQKFSSGLPVQTFL